jgi:hypothetical protein
MGEDAYVRSHDSGFTCDSHDAPGSAREMQAGRDGLEVLAFGSHVPGDGEMVSDWRTS